jgi:hypothetical protein
MTPRARVVTQGLSISLYIFIPLACLLVGTTLFFSSNRPPKAESDLVKAAAVQGTSKWLIPDDAYLAKYPPPKVGKVGTDVSQPSPTVASNGPIARRLLSLLTGSLPSSARPIAVEDLKSPNAPPAGQLVAELPDGGVINATQQQLLRPLPYSAIGFTEQDQLLSWPSGTQVVLMHRPSFVQAVMLKPDGLMRQVSAVGVPARAVAPPLSEPQLLAIMRKLDNG